MKTEPISSGNENLRRETYLSRVEFCNRDDLGEVYFNCAILPSTANQN